MTKIAFLEQEATAAVLANVQTEVKAIRSTLQSQHRLQVVLRHLSRTLQEAPRRQFRIQ